MDVNAFLFTIDIIQFNLHERLRKIVWWLIVFTTVWLFFFGTSKFGGNMYWIVVGAFIASILYFIVFRNYGCTGRLFIQYHDVILRRNDEIPITFKTNEIDSIELVYGGYHGDSLFSNILVRGVDGKDGTNNYLRIYLGGEQFKFQIYLKNKSETEVLKMFVEAFGAKGKIISKRFISFGWPNKEVFSD